MRGPLPFFNRGVQCQEELFDIEFMEFGAMLDGTEGGQLAVETVQTETFKNLLVLGITTGYLL